MACIASLNKAILEDGSNPYTTTIAKAVILAGDKVGSSTFNCASGSSGDT